MFRLPRCIGLLAAGLSLGLALTGCSTPATREAMKPQTVVAGKTHPYSVHVQVSGGSETSAISGTNVSDADLKAAIEDAVRQNKVFKTVIQNAGADYELSVRVIRLSKPLFGTTFTVDMETAWSLVRVSDKSVVLRQSVKSSGTATMSDAFVGATRLRLAVENAAREGIGQGLSAIAALTL
jgi:hypothetical protein